MRVNQPLTNKELVDIEFDLENSIGGESEFTRKPIQNNMVEKKESLSDWLASLDAEQELNKNTENDSIADFLDTFSPPSNVKGGDIGDWLASLDAEQEQIEQEDEGEDFEFSPIANPVSLYQREIQEKANAAFKRPTLLDDIREAGSVFNPDKGIMDRFSDTLRVMPASRAVIKGLGAAQRNILQSENPSNFAQGALVGNLTGSIFGSLGIQDMLPEEQKLAKEWTEKGAWVSGDTTGNNLSRVLGLMTGVLLTPESMVSAPAALTAKAVSMLGNIGGRAATQAGVAAAVNVPTDYGAQRTIESELGVPFSAEQLGTTAAASVALGGAIGAVGGRIVNNRAARQEVINKEVKEVAENLFVKEQLNVPRPDYTYARNIKPREVGPNATIESLSDDLQNVILSERVKQTHLTNKVATPDTANIDFTVDELLKRGTDHENLKSLMEQAFVRKGVPSETAFDLASEVVVKSMRRVYGDLNIANADKILMGIAELGADGTYTLPNGVRLTNKDAASFIGAKDRFDALEYLETEGLYSREDIIDLVTQKQKVTGTALTRKRAEKIDAYTYMQEAERLILGKNVDIVDLPISRRVSRIGLEDRARARVSLTGDSQGNLTRVNPQTGAVEQVDAKPLIHMARAAVARHNNDYKIVDTIYQASSEMDNVYTNVRRTDDFFAKVNAEGYTVTGNITTPEMARTVREGTLRATKEGAPDIEVPLLTLSKNPQELARDFDDLLNIPGARETLAEKSAFNKYMLDTMVENQLITRADADRMAAANPNYTPMYRVKEEALVDGILTPKNPASKTRSGGTAEIGDSITNYVNYVNRVHAISGRSNIHRTFIEGTLKEGSRGNAVFGELFEESASALRQTMRNIDEALEKGIQPDASVQRMETPDIIQRQGEYEFLYKGQTIRLTPKRDTLLADTLAWMDKTPNLDSTTRKNMHNFFKGSASIYREAIVTFNALFAPVSTWRDVLDRPMMTRDISLLAKQLGSAARYIGSRQLRQDWKRQYGFTTKYGMEQIPEQNALSTEEMMRYLQNPTDSYIGKSVWKPLQDWSTSWELGARFVEYDVIKRDLLKQIPKDATPEVRTRLQIEAEDTAMLSSREISGPYLQQPANKAALSTQMRAYVPFLGALINSADKAVRRVNYNPAQVATGAAVLATAYTPILYNNYVYSVDENGVSPLSRYSKDEQVNNIHFFDKEGNLLFRIPAGFNLSKIVHTMMHTVVNEMTQENNESAKLFVEGMYNAFTGAAPDIMSVLPPALKAGLEATLNYSFYTKSPITPDYAPGSRMLVPDRANNAALKKMFEFLYNNGYDVPVSQDQVLNVLNNIIPHAADVFSMVGIVAMQMLAQEEQAAIRITDLPFVKRFFAERPHQFEDYQVAMNAWRHYSQIDRDRKRLEQDLENEDVREVATVRLQQFLEDYAEELQLFDQIIEPQIKAMFDAQKKAAEIKIGKGDVPVTPEREVLGDPLVRDAFEEAMEEMLSHANYISQTLRDIEDNRHGSGVLQRFYNALEITMD